MTTLDNVEEIRRNDPENMYNRIFDLPEQMSKAMKIAEGWSVTPDQFAGAQNIVVIGMGGSAIGGDLVRSLLSSKLLIPFSICRNYTLPEYVDDETIVIISSYSGNTEETLSATEDAMKRKSMLAAITTGGMLEDIAKLNEIPMLQIPPGLQPRAAIGYSFVPLLLFLDKIGLVKGMADQIKKLIATLLEQREKLIEDEPIETNPAKIMAKNLQGKIPIIYGGPSITEVVSVRWKGQICENAKNLAFANQYPEFNHNELVGWSDLVEKHKENLAVIQLTDIEDHPQIQRRMDIVKGIISQLGVSVYDVKGIGASPLERMFTLIQLGDFVSYYLAILNEVDPSPVAVIEVLKKALSK